MIFTAGYSGHTVDELRRAAEDLNAAVVDIRYSPLSRRPEWRRERLQTALGDSYFWCHHLGNMNYKGNGPIEIAHPDCGVRFVRYVLRRYFPHMILICGCRKPATCHRTVVATLLRDRGFSVEELVWPEPGREEEVYEFAARQQQA